MNNKKYTEILEIVRNNINLLLEYHSQEILENNIKPDVGCKKHEIGRCCVNDELFRCGKLPCQINMENAQEWVKRKNPL